MVFAHLLVKELNTKLKEEFNEDPDDADLYKLISDPSLEPSVCVYTAVADPTTNGRWTLLEASGPMKTQRLPLPSHLSRWIAGIQAEISQAKDLVPMGS